jgi:nicotinamide-nucleotide amidase
LSVTSADTPRAPTVVLVSQGDELLTGQTVDTNAAWLGERLTERGFRVLYGVTAPDEHGYIVRAVAEAFAAADVVICTGGLGPTSDDLTAEAVAEVLGVPLALDEPSLERIRALYARWGRPMPDANIKQAMLPVGARVLPNDWGTAPGFLVERGSAAGFFVPGVPREMRAFWEHHILPDLEARFERPPMRRVVLRCMGIAESSLEERMRPLMGEPDLTVSFRTKLPENQVKLIFAPGAAGDRVEALTARALEAIGRSCFGIDTGPIAEVVGAALADRGETLATAESCTGGLVSAQITEIAGASRYYLEGACVYSNEAKIRTCGVDPEALAAHGAVSEVVARQLAEGIRARAGATYGLATTGVAGPSGGSPEKPVGTVHIALAAPAGTTHRHLKLAGSRDRITSMSAGLVLDLLRRHLQAEIDPDTN